MKNKNLLFCNILITHNLFWEKRLAMQHAGPSEAGDQGGKKPPEAAPDHVDTGTLERKGTETVAAGRKKLMRSEERAEELKGGAKVSDKPEASQNEPINSAELKKMNEGGTEISRPTAEEQSMIESIKAQIKAINQKGDPNAPPIKHRDVGRATGTDRYDRILVYDMHHTPPERLFKSKTQNKDAMKDDAAEKLDYNDILNDMLAGSPRQKLDSSDPNFKKYVNMLGSKLREQGSAQSYIDANNNCFAVIKDNNAQGGFVVYKGKEK